MGDPPRSSRTPSPRRLPIPGGASPDDPSNADPHPGASSAQKRGGAGVLVIDDVVCSCLGIAFGQIATLGRVITVAERPYRDVKTSEGRRVPGGPPFLGGLE